MFIFENNFNLLSTHFEKKKKKRRRPQRHTKPRWAAGRLFRLAVYLFDGCSQVSHSDVLRLTLDLP